jgi:hypothetical protein
MKARPLVQGISPWAIYIPVGYCQASCRTRVYSFEVQIPQIEVPLSKPMPFLQNGRSISLRVRPKDQPSPDSSHFRQSKCSSVRLTRRCCRLAAPHLAYTHVLCPCHSFSDVLSPENTAAFEVGGDVGGGAVGAGALCVTATGMTDRADVLTDGHALPAATTKGTKRIRKWQI